MFWDFGCVWLNHIFQLYTCYCVVISDLSILLSGLSRRLELMTQAVTKTVDIRAQCWCCCCCCCTPLSVDSYWMSHLLWILYRQNSKKLCWCNCFFTELNQICHFFSLNLLVFKTSYFNLQLPHSWFVLYLSDCDAFQNPFTYLYLFTPVIWA